MNPTTLYMTIEILQRRRRFANIEPDHALWSEIKREHKNVPEAELREALVKLVNDGRAAVGKTINDGYVKTL